jgi:hypothetical protein
LAVLKASPSTSTGETFRRGIPAGSAAGRDGIWRDDALVFVVGIFGNHRPGVPAAVLEVSLLQGILGSNGQLGAGDKGGVHVRDSLSPLDQQF